MRIGNVAGVALAVLGLGGFPISICAQDHQHAMTGAPGGQADSRQLVTFPEPMRLHTALGAVMQKCVACHAAYRLH